MLYEDLLHSSSPMRSGYLADVLKAAVTEALYSGKPQGISVTETLAVFSLTDVERYAVQREAIERLRGK